MPDERQYPVSYSIDAKNPRSAAELRAAGLGGCDALILVSVIFRADGSRSQQAVSIDGRSGGDLPPDEWFKSWVLLAHGLMNQTALTTGERDLCAMVFEAIRRTKVPGPHPTPADFMRDRVLDEAAKVCETKRGLVDGSEGYVDMNCEEVLTECAAEIRAMKGP
jgi:hypothetical protein